MNETLIRALKDVAWAAGLLGSLAAVAGVAHVFPDAPPPVPGDGQVKITTTRNLFGERSIYGARTKSDDEKRIDVVKQGGTQESFEAVKSGLDWLVRHQALDGSWSSVCVGPGAESRCERYAACTGPGEPYPFAQTGLALLALQGDGHFDFSGQYSGHVRRGLAWLVQQQHPDGGLHSGSIASNGYYMYEHGMAAFALCEACAVAVAAQRAPDETFRQAAQKAVRFIEYQQHDDGGWRYTGEKSERSDTSVSGWQVLALKSALAAKLDVGPGSIDRLKSFFASCETGRDGRTGYMAGSTPNTEATTGVGMLVHHFMLSQPDSELVRQAAPFLASLAERRGWGGNDYYLWYNCTLAMFLSGGQPWERWNSIVRDTVIGLQAKGGCARGSWPPENAVYGSAGGRIYTTALAVLTLESYYRFVRAAAHDSEK